MCGGQTLPFEIDRNLYTRMYGPTVGDRVWLGDTNLLGEVERDYASPGDETLWGFGKTSLSMRACWTSMQPLDSGLLGGVGYSFHHLA